MWNLGGSKTTTLADLVERIARGLGTRPSVRFAPARPGDVERTWADIARARRELDWEPTTALDAGLARFLEWLAERASQRPGAREAR